MLLCNAALVAVGSQERAHSRAKIAQRRTSFGKQWIQRAIAVAVVHQRRDAVVEQPLLRHGDEIENLIADRDARPVGAIGRAEDTERKILDREVGVGHLRGVHPRREVGAVSVVEEDRHSSPS